MNEQLAKAARDAGIVAVEHVIETTYSDDRAPDKVAITHNIAAAENCSYCKHVRQNMELRATLNRPRRLIEKERPDGSDD